MHKHEVLFVDDEPNVLSGYRRTLHNKFNMTMVSSGSEALDIIIKKEKSFAVAVVDMRMPEMDGITLLKELMDKEPDIVRIMLTGNSDQQTAIDAVNEGQIFRFLSKPCSPENMEKAISAGIKQHELITAEKELLEHTLSGSVKVLFDILSMTNSQAFQHAANVRDVTVKVSKNIGLKNLWKIKLVAMLSHVGMITIPQEILDKVWRKDSLSTLEQEIFNRLSQVNCELLKNIPRLEPIIKIIKYMNKNYDGSGFPKDDIKGKEIPIEARIIKIVSDFIDMAAYHPISTVIFEVLQGREGVYDLELLHEMKHHLIHIANEEKSKTTSIVRELFVKDLESGQFLASDVKRVNGQVLLTANQKLTDLIIKKLMNSHEMFGIEEPIKVRIPDVSK
ncbi:MAG: response regulator [Alphaproteobacteria bacterium]|nr:response regulator [Alphaproteobacteria bacterium]